MHINLEKVENCNRVFQVDSFEKEYRALFGKNPFVFSRYQNKLLFNLQQLDAEGLKVLSFCERFAQTGSGFMFTDNSSPDEIDDETFSKLSTSSSYEISGSKVIVDIKGNDDFEFNLD